MSEAEDNRDMIAYISVDSAPKRFAGFIPQWRGPAMLAMFTLLAVAMLLAVNSPTGAAIFPNRDLVFSPYEGRHSIAIRIFLVAFYISFAAFSSADWKGKLTFGLDMVLTYALICAIFDLANVAGYMAFDLAFSLHFSAIASGLLGFCIYSWKLLERGLMPVRIPVEHRPVSNRRAIIRLIVTIAIAVATSVWITSLQLEMVERLRSWTLLGGIGPGVFLVLPVFFAQLYALAIWDVKTAKTPRFNPPVSIIVPAHNEEYIIENTIRAMDKAAAHYGGEVHILIMNNNSTDATEEIANTTLAECEAATGRVINVPKPGKSNALNAGLDAAETEFLVRVDADTLVGEDNLTRAMPYFSNPAVGVVGGVPVPPGGALFDRARLLEVLVAHSDAFGHPFRSHPATCSEVFGHL